MAASSNEVTVRRSCLVFSGGAWCPFVTWLNGHNDHDGSQVREG